MIRASKAGKIVRIFHDGISSGQGHKARAETIAQRLGAFGFEVVIYDLDELTTREKLIQDEQNLVGTVIDSYRPRRYFADIDVERSPRVLQIIDFDRQEAWGDWILDPFSATGEVEVTSFRGLNYAVVPDLPDFQPRAALNDHLIICLGSSSPLMLGEPLLHQLSDDWAEVTLVASEPTPFKQPHNMKMVAPKSRLEFWKLVSEHSFMISNAGVTGLERVYFQFPGICIPTEPNQRFAARALASAGVNICSLGAGPFPPLSSLAKHEVAWNRIPEKVSIGDGLEDVLKEFVHAEPA